MAIKQLSVFVGNNQGSLAEITGSLGDAGIDLLALTIADTADYGILRIIVSNTDTAIKILESKGYAVKENNVVAVKIPNVPGGFAKVLKIISENGISVEYSYSFFALKGQDAYIVIRVDDDYTIAETILNKNNIKTLSQQDIECEAN